MKKHIIAFLICSVFAGASAQNYTQVFDSVFQHVDLSHTTTGILYERVLPKVKQMRYRSAESNTRKNDTDATDAHCFKHSVGISAFSSFVGVSLKFNLAEKLYLQADFGGEAYLNFLFIPITPGLGADFGTQLYFLYEDLFPKRTNTYWLAGLGLNFAGVPHIPYSKQVSIKGGVKALFGVEFIPDNSYLSFQVDTRWGYGIMYSTKGVKPWERNGYLPEDNPYRFLDYSFVFTLRFHLGKNRSNHKL